MDDQSAPILSTPAEHIFEAPEPVAIQESRISDEQLYLQYEIKQTVDEIREGRWRRIALQFPDEMLVDAPRVFERLRDGLKAGRVSDSSDASRTQQRSGVATNHQGDGQSSPSDGDVALTILADTSYGACCVDEVAAEHVDAEVVVHYGRACLSPTARLPVIYVFTSKSLDLEAALESFQSTYSDKDEKVCLMADIPYSHHLSALTRRLEILGYNHIHSCEIVRDPSSFLPNRTVPEEVSQDPAVLREYAVFHISSPPTSLLLILSSRVKAMHIYPTDSSNTESPAPALEASTAQILRRRYALIVRLSTVSIFGILINTLSVSNYMGALRHCQELIAEAGKKSYVFVVGKVNAAKIANFSEIGGWVVIGCWESSLIESKDFYRPIITPFELEVALTDDQNRLWGGDWISDFSALLAKKSAAPQIENDQTLENNPTVHDGDWDDQPSDDEPPEFDLRTGKYVSNTRPMGRRKPQTNASSAPGGETSAGPAPTSWALANRAKGDIATIGGQVSPAAEFLRQKRTWQGLGSDHEIAYERDEQGKIRGAAVQEGRSGIARGYAVGTNEEKS